MRIHKGALSTTDTMKRYEDSVAQYATADVEIREREFPSDKTDETLRDSYRKTDFEV